jgi:hypothetical protein
LFKKPEVADVYAFLRKRTALIVHFSGAPKGSGVERGSTHLFPADLLHVINRHARGGLSCSVVRPGDVFHGFERNATGCVGVVLGLQSKDSLIAADPTDCGSIEDESGIRSVAKEQDITMTDLARTLDERTGYNEWVIRDYVVLGRFQVPPREVSILSVFEFPDDMPEYLRDDTPIPDIRVVGIDELSKTFAMLTIYTFAGGRICRQVGNDIVPVDHSEIYPVP